jgi:hypothetical protein
MKKLNWKNCQDHKTRFDYEREEKRMDNINAMAEFTELMKHEPNKAYDFISNNYTNY